MRKRKGIVVENKFIGMTTEQMDDEEYEEFKADMEAQREQQEWYDEDDDYDWENDPYDRIPDGCRACGGPYPNCLDSCPMGEEGDY